ncbi:MAG TPA: VOC family protein [Propionicimonas sp.]|jgi:catechol 2,3-dioxygenase-like lactoylglutathione lyase family enzyme|uniref:VOC family protein n=1 Tax=Propionicimonas sp. TaxID=1955623 RepID=UPI002F422A12
MEPIGLLAQSTVSDLDTARSWYTAVLGRDADATPMQGLLEWHFSDDAGVQLWRDPVRAGTSTTVLEVVDLDAELTRLDDLGIAHDDPMSTPRLRLVTLEDPDRNRLILAGV